MDQRFGQPGGYFTRRGNRNFAVRRVSRMLPMAHQTLPIDHQSHQRPSLPYGDLQRRLPRRSAEAERRWIGRLQCRVADALRRHRYGALGPLLGGPSQTTEQRLHMERLCDRPRSGASAVEEALYRSGYGKDSAQLCAELMGKKPLSAKPTVAENTPAEAYATGGTDQPSVLSGVYQMIRSCAEGVYDNVKGFFWGSPPSGTPDGTNGAPAAAEMVAAGGAEAPAAAEMVAAGGAEAPAASAAQAEAAAWAAEAAEFLATFAEVFTQVVVSANPLLALIPLAQFLSNPENQLAAEAAVEAVNEFLPNQDQLLGQGPETVAHATATGFLHFLEVGRQANGEPALWLVNYYSQPANYPTIALVVTGITEAQLVNIHLELARDIVNPVAPMWNGLFLWALENPQHPLWMGPDGRLLRGLLTNHQPAAEELLQARFGPGANATMIRPTLDHLVHAALTETIPLLEGMRPIPLGQAQRMADLVTGLQQGHLGVGAPQLAQAPLPLQTLHRTLAMQQGMGLLHLHQLSLLFPQENLFGNISFPGHWHHSNPVGADFRPLGTPVVSEVLDLALAIAPADHGAFDLPQP